MVLEPWNFTAPLAFFPAFAAETFANNLNQTKQYNEHLHASNNQLSENGTSRKLRGRTFCKGTRPSWKMPDLVITPCGGNWQKRQDALGHSVNSSNQSIQTMPKQKGISGFNPDLGSCLQSLDDSEPLSQAFTTAWTFQLLATSQPGMCLT